MARTSTLLFACVALVLAVGCGGGGSPAVFTGGPVISSIEPASGGMAGGTGLVIRGTDLSNPQAGEYQILIGGQPATEITVVDDTEVECTTPPGPSGAADVEIVNLNGEATAAGGFMYYAPPTISSITPAIGTRDGGVPVTVTGTGFEANDPGLTLCLIELKELDNLVVVDDTTITGLTPSSWVETTRNVTVKNRNGEATLTAGFRYVGPVPTIDPGPLAIDPDFGETSGGLLVTIHGEHYTEAGGELSVRFGDAEASAVTRIDDETLTCITPVSTVTGFVDVTVGNNNGETTRTDGFYYLPPPVPETITPDHGPIDGGTTVTITGTGFAAGSGPVTVLFDTTLATSVNVVDDFTLTCDAPAGVAVATVDVKVFTTNGSGTIEDGYTYDAPLFWWENTLGTAGLTGDTTATPVSLPFGFPFFGTNWSNVYAIGDGHLDFGSTAYASFSFAGTLLPIPHISHMSADMNLSTGRQAYYTSHVPGRTIITYNNVPQWSSVGANFVQIHLHKSGIFCILYKNITFFDPAGFGSVGSVAVNPGGGSSVTVDWTSGAQSGGATDALNESFTSAADLANSHLTFFPNASGGVDSTYTVGVPTDPNP